MNASTCSTGAPYLVAAAMTESSPTEQTNALLAAVVASSMDAVFSIDTNARIQTWNSTAEQLCASSTALLKAPTSASPSNNSAARCHWEHAGCRRLWSAAGGLALGRGTRDATT